MEEKTDMTETEKTAAAAADASCPAEPTAEETDEATAQSKEKHSRRHRSERELLAALEEAEKKAADAEAARAEEHDRCLRIAAEYDNYRRRSQKEREGCYTDAVSDVLRDVLPLLDNLERASVFTDAEQVAAGLAMTVKSGTELLLRLGVEEIPAAPGTPFDPTLHNAVLHIEDESLGENVVAEVLQRGYRRGERVLRYAMVKVAN